MSSFVHDQARVEGDAFAKRYWEENAFLPVRFSQDEALIGTIVTRPPVPASEGSGRTIYQWYVGKFTEPTKTFMMNCALAAIENEASALTYVRPKWTDPTVIAAWKEAAIAQAQRLLDERARLPAPSGRV